MADGSTRVVLTAMAGNLAIAAVKFAAYLFTRSSAMLTESIHSLVDTGDQLLLLVGQRRGGRPPDPSHPLGYGMETYFWSFIVALMVFLLGGAVSIWQGAHKIAHPEPISRPWISYVVLGVSAVFEGGSFAAAYREYKAVVRGRDVELFRYLQLSKDPSVMAVLLEDGAAMIGLALAALGVTGAAYLHLPWADGAASIAIGALLMAVAGFLANETRSLIAGEGAAGPVVAAVRDMIERDPCVDRVDDLVSLQLGPKAILIGVTLKFRTEGTAQDVQRAASDLTAKIKSADPRIALVFLRPGS